MTNSKQKTTRAKALRKNGVIGKGLKTAPSSANKNQKKTVSASDRLISNSIKNLNGVYPAVVREVRDPDNQGRVKVGLPWLSRRRVPIEYKESGIWARLATLMAGYNRGSWFIPDVGDEVLVAFEQGDIDHPYVIGSLWNGKNTPPEHMDANGENHLKILRSRNGVNITLDDTNGNESLVLETPGGQKISLMDQNKTLIIKDNNGNHLEFAPSGITINVTSRLKINASALEISASQVEINSGITKASGIVQCDTLITNSVVSSSYTPGAGNLA